MDQQENTFTRVIKAAIQRRMQILLTTCPLEFLQENYEIVAQAKTLVHFFENTDNLHRQKFLGHLLIAGTRLWEQYRKNEQQLNRSSNLSQRCYKKFSMKIIVPFPHQNLIQAAKNDILANIATFNILTQEDLTVQDIEQFFQLTQIMGFYSKTRLTGLSAYDGSILYVNLRVIENDKLKATLVHETGHNLPRSRMAYHNPRSISCENNPFQVLNSQQAEAGYFVEYWVYQRSPSPVDPFSLRLEDD